jgi:catechol 2,3-dioxygenase-like lactoylglutathione lyase family enzyme
MSTDRRGVEPAGSVVGIDHVALPMEDAEAMAAFYRSLGLPVAEHRHLVRVQLGDQMINFHRPDLWKRGFSLRAPNAVPACGDLCLVWSGPGPALLALLARAGVEVEEGPVEREGGRGRSGSSVYVRDPDGNLIEFITYTFEAKEHAHVS